MPFNPSEDITIPRLWLERVEILRKKVETSSGTDYPLALDMLLDYLSSVETILKLKK